MSHAQFEFDLNGRGNNRPLSPPAAVSKSDTDLYVGLQPAAVANTLATEIAGDFMRRLRVTEAIRPLHVTLSALGRRSRFSTLDLAAKMEELSSVVIEPFMLTFDQIMSFDRHADKKALVLCCSRPNAYLHDLQRKIAEAQRQPGIEAEMARAFTPHMTLFYTQQHVLRQSLKTPVKWLVRDFHILWSHIGECRHESLWQWPPSA
jgi:2'-5' RNA ligase